MFAALIAVFTAWLLHIPVVIGQNTAYLHFGDAFIFLAASMLPTPYACAASAIGGGLADILCGVPVWAPFTIVVKALMALCFTCKGKTIVTKRNLLCVIPCLVITIVIYYIAEALIYGNWIAPVFSIFGNVVQIIGSFLIYALVGFALDKTKIKSSI